MDHCLPGKKGFAGGSCLGFRSRRAGAGETQPLREMAIAAVSERAALPSSHSIAWTLPHGCKSGNWSCGWAAAAWAAAVWSDTFSGSIRVGRARGELPTHADRRHRGWGSRGFRM